MTDLLKPVNSNKPLTATQEKQIRVLGLVSEYYNVYQKLEQVLKRGFVDLARANYEANTRYQNFLDHREMQRLVDVDWTNAQIILCDREDGLSKTYCSAGQN
ncbi:hypothetical protein KL905_001628 [Ogataea polymorpha]|nr:hypothetical protein KL937_000099 [Ogataea polymorpha]KAG7895612.1 hypothetical protein KL936_000320 [Ogataea polymorpha]KAG7905921.1 hypothetical protein KL906_004991 [Ogataea polymorpha]KAG7908186.1 hypothetical protein KL907_001676 [Ogataea polymorpha]KAG7921202.1 hypothetical protein KL927_000446 [Ogataea polymorpha]